MKFLFFDLDDTLLDFHKTEAWAIRQALRRSGVEPTDAIVARYSEINQRQWELLEEKKLTREQVLLRRFQLLFRELRVNASCEETQRCYENMLAKGHDFMPGAPELLERLRAAGRNLKD